MEYYFLKKDAEALRSMLDGVDEQRMSLAQDAAVNVGQSSETFHDNAGFEVALREQMSLAKKSSDLRAILAKMRVVEPSNKSSKVSIGCQIVLKDIDTGESRVCRVGSYRVLAQKFKEELPYTAPIIEPFIGKRVGVKRVIATPGGDKRYELVKIEACAWE